ncbi:CBO0543 family protein [Paenibacillus chartarius]|uniref:CBO0543 family protein n=1 Tax=Paenibacillus chartarius TaxID=747481 RepID=A0ABV6DL28_9BACL
MKPIQDPEKLRKIGEFYDKIVETHYDYFQYWLHHTWFHWDFWISFALTVLPWALWIKFRKKDSTDRQLFVAFFVILISSWLDFIGTCYGLWYYTGKVIPTIPVYIPWDFCLLPVFLLFLLQFKPNSPAVIKALGFACVCSFAGEPFFQWLGFYVMKKWSVCYSFPIYFVIFLAAYKLSKRSSFSAI